MRRSFPSSLTGIALQARMPAWLGACLVLAAALAFRVGLLHAPGEFDEFYHLLAARGWLETGSPRILDGEYWRGALFTRMVAGLFEITGSQDLPTARLVSVAAGSLVPVVLFLWLDRVVGPGPALLAAVFAILWPQGLLESQFVRFYALHVLTFLSGAVTFYLLLVGGGVSRLFYGLATALFWSLAVQLQISSVIGISAALLGGLPVLAIHRNAGLRAWLLMGGGLVSLALVAAAVLGTTDIGERAWAFYRWTPAHAAALRDYYGFYFNQLQMAYGVLWLASLVLVPLGLRINAALTLFCGTIFTICFLTHSFGGMKALRYLSYAMPFLFVMWALGLCAVFDLLKTRGVDPRLRVALALAAGIGVVTGTDFAPRSLELASGAGLPPRGDWSEGAAVVGDWGAVPFVATTRELHHVAHIGSYDVLFSRSRVTELDPPQDFGVDPRTGRPVVGHADNILRILRCVPDGLLVTSPHWWRSKGWQDRLLPRVTENGTELSMRERGALLAIRWRNANPLPDSCNTLSRDLPAAVIDAGGAGARGQDVGPVPPGGPPGARPGVTAEVPT